MMSRAAREMLRQFQRCTLARVFLLSTTVFALFSAKPGWADEAVTIQTCKNYVARVASQLDMASGCSFYNASDRWSENLASHFDWCKGANPTALSAEDAKRQSDLQTCIGPGRRARINNCEDYVARAMSQINLQEAKSCGYSGPQWSRDNAMHLTWCRSAPAADRENEDYQRQTALAKCGPRQDAVAQNQPKSAVEVHLTIECKNYLFELFGVGKNKFFLKATGTATVLSNGEVSAIKYGNIIDYYIIFTFKPPKGTRAIYVDEIKFEINRNTGTGKSTIYYNDKSPNYIQNEVCHAREAPKPKF